ncbi:hypothetical protein ACFFKC_16115 [Pseudoduganella danionis]|uniref:Secretion system X translation initiation factor n=1 Tax=Pseudoduganella danionis TaxID=1890295 RepID=A0ABW9SMP6_9BURK|nr:hypothetical protein [Pseudoduganella danionis]MTW33416.1 hypothetical protein [Pseudoduganella danionis]
MKPYQILMALALAAAAALLIFGDSSPDSGIAEAVQRSVPAATSEAASVPSAAAPERNAKAHADAAILRLIPRSTLVGEADEATFAAGAGIFQGQSWNPPAPPPAAVSHAAPAAPTAPPVPFAVIGKALADGVWEVYLVRGDKTYVVRPQTIIDGSYRVEKIAPPAMSITYLPLNQVQQMNIGALD